MTGLPEFFLQRTYVGAPQKYFYRDRGYNSLLYFELSKSNFLHQKHEYKKNDRTL